MQEVIVIPIVIGVLGTVAKRLVQELEDLEIRRQVEIQETCCHSESCGKPFVNAGVKKSQMS